MSVPSPRERAHAHHRVLRRPNEPSAHRNEPSARTGALRRELRPTSRTSSDDLPVEAELVAPVLAVERPDDVLVVGLDDAVRERLLLGDLAADDLLVELVALGSGDVDEDLARVAEVLVELVEVALVALAGELPALRTARSRASCSASLTSLPSGELRNARRRLLEARILLVEDADVLEVAEELAIARARSRRSA